jgi:FixJ family two-component response regulator
MQPAPLVCAVDDDQAVCESLDGLLRSAGVAVRTFSSPDDFLQWSQSHETDCLILDFAMPGMNGLQLRRALLDRGLSVPVIFATAVGDEEVWSQLTSSGAFAVFAKPLDADALLDAVRRAVTGGQAQ